MSLAVAWPGAERQDEFPWTSLACLRQHREGDAPTGQLSGPYLPADCGGQIQFIPADCGGWSQPAPDRLVILTSGRQPAPKIGGSAAPPPSAASRSVLYWCSWRASGGYLCRGADRGASAGGGGAGRGGGSDLRHTHTRTRPLTSSRQPRALRRNRRVPVGRRRNRCCRPPRCRAIIEPSVSQSARRRGRVCGVVIYLPYRLVCWRCGGVDTCSMNTPSTG